MTEIFGTGGIERRHGAEFFKVKQRDNASVENRLAFKQRLVEYRDTLIAFGALKPGQKLGTDDVKHVLESMGYNQKIFTDALKAAWGIRITFKELLQRLDAFDKEKKLKD